MKNEKKIIIIVGLVLFCLYGGYMVKYFIKNSAKPSGGGGTVEPAILKNDFFPFSYKAEELNPLKITLADTQAAVIKILGTPKAITKTQNMLASVPTEFGQDCQYLIYEDFFVSIREGKVSGWYFNPTAINSKNNLFYLPGLKTQERGVFLDLYKNWENLSNQGYTQTFANFEKYNLGDIYFCAIWGDTATEKGEMALYSYNEKYNLRQMYVFDAKKLILKVIGTETLPVITSGKVPDTMFLGRNLAYIKNYFAKAVLAREKEETGIDGEKVHIVSFSEGTTMYRFDFNKEDACISVAVSYQ